MPAGPKLYSGWQGTQVRAGRQADRFALLVDPAAGEPRRCRRSPRDQAGPVILHSLTLPLGGGVMESVQSARRASQSCWSASITSRPGDDQLPVGQLDVRGWSGRQDREVLDQVLAGGQLDAGTFPPPPESA